MAYFDTCHVRARAAVTLFFKNKHEKNETWRPHGPMNSGNQSPGPASIGLHDSTNCNSFVGIRGPETEFFPAPAMLRVALLVLGV